MSYIASSLVTQGQVVFLSSPCNRRQPTYASVSPSGWIGYAFLSRWGNIGESLRLWKCVYCELWCSRHPYPLWQFWGVELLPSVTSLCTWVAKRWCRKGLFKAHHKLHIIHIINYCNMALYIPSIYNAILQPFVGHCHGVTFMFVIICLLSFLYCHC